MTDKLTFTNKERYAVRRDMEAEFWTDPNEFIDCGEVDATALAETMACLHDREEWLEEGHELWDVAAECADDLEKMI